MATEAQRLYFRDKFKSLFNEGFQNWFEDLARSLHPVGDFQKVRKTSGDGGLDGFAISSQLVYQVYAPARISELNDAETAAKIRADFQTASKTLGGQLKSWTFVHNHPQAALGKLSIAAISELRSQNSNIQISVLDIDSLWEKLKELPTESLAGLCGVPLLGKRDYLMAEGISDLHKEVAAGTSKTLEALSKLPHEIELRVNRALRSATAEGSQEADHLKSVNQKRFDRARQELIYGSVVVAEKEYRALVTDLEYLGARADIKLLFRSYTNLGSSLWQQFRRDEAVVWFDKAYATKPEEEKAKTNKAAAHIHRREFQAALDILTALKAANPDCFDAHYLISCVYSEQGEVHKSIAALEERRFENNTYFEALAQAYLRCENFAKAVEAAKAGLAKDANSAEAMVLLADSLGFPVVQRQSRRELKAFSITDAERKQILEAIQAGEAAVKMLRKHARNFQLGEMLTNLSAFSMRTQ